ncbi:vWA domain-containing protein [Haloglomus litoreum]|uniref:vWA domain-containing protein n=1 Tax=Haloglomus litoreum TaxID=3034026 RepID=UPI0023E7E3F1|nr:vWA domain-containing protein [Haloglomus sp. DT116]
MTNNNTETTQLYPLTRRDMMRTAAFVAGAATVGGAATTMFPTVRADEHTVIETCGGDVDIVIALDYSGSIRNAGTWPDIESGVDSFLDVVPEDIQLGLVTFGDAPDAFQYGPNNLLDLATAANVTALKAGVPTTTPPGENATHMPGALAYANAILEEEGRDGKEIVVLITDGGPNYQNGVVGDGVTPPADDTTAFPYGTFEFTGGTTGGENGIAGEPGELTETSGVADDIDSAGRRIIAVGIGENVAGFDDYLRDEIASTPDDFVPVTDAANLGTELEALISEVCEPECEECELAGMVKYEYEVEYEDDEVVFDGFVLDGEYDGGITYVSDEDKDGSMYDPMSATFNLGDLCSAWAVVKAGQEFAVVEVTADGNGDVTVDYIAPYAISFVAFFCTPEAAQAYAENFPSRGRGGGRPDRDARTGETLTTSDSSGSGGNNGRGHAYGRGKATGKGNGLARGRNR